jgi:hypothetical protein
VPECVWVQGDTMKVETKKIVVETEEIHYEVGDLVLAEVSSKMSKSKWFIVISTPKNRDYFEAIPLDMPYLHDGVLNKWILKNKYIIKDSPVFHFPIKGIGDIEISNWS